MYTRSYPKAEIPKKTEITLPPTPPPELFTETVTEKVPEGYCGTALLREKEPEQPATEKVTQTISDKAFSPYGRVRKFKVATKVTPSLWNTESRDPETHTDEEAPCPKEHDEQLARNTECEQFNEAPTRQCCEEPNTAHDRNDKDNCHRHDLKKQRFSFKKSSPDRTPNMCLRERSFSIEDLLLGGLILLLLNEGADDDIILILGFLLFSAI